MAIQTKARTADLCIMNDDQSSTRKSQLYRCVIARLMGPTERLAATLKPVVKVVCKARKREKDRCKRGQSTNIFINALRNFDNRQKVGRFSMKLVHF